MAKHSIVSESKVSTVELAAKMVASNIAQIFTKIGLFWGCTDIL